MSQSFLRAGFSAQRERQQGQPFPKGALGCAKYRIPGLYSLNDGGLFAVCDARWDLTDDAGGLDTAAALSDDNGGSWESFLPVFFPDSERNPDDLHDATICIDPCVVQSAAGRIHILVDLCPTGITTLLCEPGTGSGFFNVRGRARLAVCGRYENARLDPAGNGGAYPYYVGDFENGFAPVLPVAGGAPAYEVDEYFNLFACSGGERTPLLQKQVNTGAAVQQNLFYRDSCLHVYNTMYLADVFSDDRGKTWRLRLVNGEVKREGDVAFLVSPGRGTRTAAGRLLIPCYRYYGGAPRTSFIYSDDDGASWRRGGNFPLTADVPEHTESEIVELPDGTLRFFLRNPTGRMVYADALPEGDGYRLTPPVRTGLRIHAGCNVSAIRHGERILFSCPAGPGRNAGRIYVFAPEKDGSMRLVRKYAVCEDDYSYSSIALMRDGALGVLYDTCDEGRVPFRRLPPV